MGRKVIYYNPHKEKMVLFNQDETGGILKAFSYEELLSKIDEAINPSKPFGQAESKFSISIVDQEIINLLNVF